MALVLQIAALVRSVRALRRSRAVLEHEQATKLRRLVAHAAAVPFWRERFAAAGVTPEQIRTPQDLRRLPILGKAELQAVALAARTSSAFPRDRLHAALTSGSTGRRLEILYDRQFLAVRQAAFVRALITCGYRPGQRVLLLTNGTRQLPPRWMRWHYASSEQPPEALLAQIEAVRPAVLYGFLTPLCLLAEHMLRNPRRLPRPRLVVSTGETLTRGGRELIERALGAPVYDFYGLTEGALLAWQARPGGCYHLAEDVAIFELVPVAGSHLCRLVVTILDLLATPIIRYDTGDLVLALPEPGSSWPFTCLERIEGRRVDCLVLPTGELLSPYYVTEALEDLVGVEQFQVVQEEIERVVVRLQGEASRDPATAAHVRRLLTPLLGPRVRIDLVPTERIEVVPGRKFKPVTSLVRAAPAEDG